MDVIMGSRSCVIALPFLLEVLLPWPFPPHYYFTVLVRSKTIK